MLVTPPHARVECDLHFSLRQVCYYVSCVKGALVLGMRSVFVFLLWWFLSFGLYLQADLERAFSPAVA